jgi:hypothetical protein
MAGPLTDREQAAPLPQHRPWAEGSQNTARPGDPAVRPALALLGTDYCIPTNACTSTGDHESVEKDENRASSRAGTSALLRDALATMRKQ